MNCCGGHEGHKESEGKDRHGQQGGHAGGWGGRKTSYIVLGVVILLVVNFVLKYFK